VVLADTVIDLGTRVIIECRTAVSDIARDRFSVLYDDGFGLDLSKIEI